MGRKRLQHVADTLCDMFRGWQLQADYEALTSWEGGELTIDAMAGTCRLDGRPVRLEMARVLQGWLLRDLAQHGINEDELREVTLRVRFDTERHEGQRDSSVSWGDPHRIFVSCQVECQSCLITADRSYDSSLLDDLEWPLPRAHR